MSTVVAGTGGAILPTEQEITQLVEQNLGVVRQLVHRTLHLFPRLPGGYEREDLHSLGHLGLVRAAQNFDPARGILFSTYAYQCIGHAISGALRHEAVQEIECVSLTPLFPDGDGAPAEDQIVDPEADTARSVLRHCNREILAREIAELPELHARVIRALYFDDSSLVQVADGCGLSKQAIQTLHSRALKVLRRRLRGLGFG